MRESIYVNHAWTGFPNNELDAYLLTFTLSAPKMTDEQLPRELTILIARLLSGKTLGAS